MSLPRLYKRFRNLMRLKGVLRAIVFTIRAHLADIRRRAYTKELLRRQAPSLLTITNPIIHTTSNLYPTPNHATSRDYTPPDQHPNLTYHLLIRYSRTTHDPRPHHHFLQSLLLSTNLTLHTTPQLRLTHLAPTLPSMPPRPRPLSPRLMGASHASNTNSFGSPHSHASVIPTSITNVTKRHNAPQCTHDRPHPPHTSPPTTQTQLAALHSTLIHQYHSPTTNRPTITTFTSDDLPLFSPTHPPPRDSTSLATTPRHVKQRRNPIRHSRPPALHTTTLRLLDQCLSTIDRHRLARRHTSTLHLPIDSHDPTHRHPLNRRIRREHARSRLRLFHQQHPIPPPYL